MGILFCHFSNLVSLVHFGASLAHHFWLMEKVRRDLLYRSYCSEFPPDNYSSFKRRITVVVEDLVIGAIISLSI